MGCMMNKVYVVMAEYIESQVDALDCVFSNEEAAKKYVNEKTNTDVVIYEYYEENVYE